MILLDFFYRYRTRSKKMRPGFKYWTTEVQRLLYEQGHPASYIAHVDNNPDYWLWMFDIDYTPQEAVDESLEDIFKKK